MRVTQSGGVVTTRNAPGAQWVLAGAVAALGLLLAAGALLPDRNPRDPQPLGARVFLGLVGAAIAAGGLYLVYLAPVVTARFDAAEGRARVRRWPGGSQSFPLADIESVEVALERPEDGDLLYHPALRRRGGRLVFLSWRRLPYGPRERAELARLAALLGVPGPPAL